MSQGSRKITGSGRAKHAVLLENVGRKAAFPTALSPMLATLADSPFSKDGWFFEPKLDGIRVLAFVRDGWVALFSRRGIDLTEKYPHICAFLSKIEGNFIFDGEIVALDQHGKPSFQHLQRSGLEKAELLYYVFDVLYADTWDLTGASLVDRKKVLQAVLEPGKSVRLVESLGNDGEAAFKACTEHGLEGVVGKDENSTYDGGRRSRSWLKVKSSLTGEFLICGFTEGTGGRSGSFGSLILGEYNDEGELLYVGGVGTGFSGEKIKGLLAMLRPLKIDSCPFKRKPRGKLNPTWVSPKLVCEVKFLERTRDKLLRAPVYLHLREDIEPRTVKEAPVVHINSSLQARSKSRKRGSI